MDKYDRIGIRAEDLVSPEVLKEKLTTVLKLKNDLLTKIYDAAPLDFDEVYSTALNGERIAPCSADVF